jgi:HAD superfamily hydrolase (TIGR01509 family)
VTQFKGVILDVDGTLVDSNDEHAKAWVKAMKENGYEVSFEKVRSLIGMGSDNLLPTTIGVKKDSPEGKKLSDSWSKIFKEEYLPGIKAFPGAKELIERIRQSGLKLAVATSGEPDLMEDLLKLVGAEDLIEEKTSSKDADKSKPNPDVVQAALEKLGIAADQSVMLGDTPYDIESAGRAGVKTIALRCGGWQDKDLKGAIAVYNDPADLLEHFDQSPLL